MKHEDESYGFVSGLFLGTTLGAMAALLLAPKSGRDVRADLYAGGERLKDRATANASHVIGRGEAAVESAKEAARETAAGVKRGAARLMGRAQAVIEDEAPASPSVSSL